MKDDIIYEIIFDYSTDDCEGIETYLYDDYDKAVRKFKEIIENEKKPELSWVGDVILNNSFDYELDTNIEELNQDEEIELWWNFVDKNDWNRHDFLDLRIKVVM